MRAHTHAYTIYGHAADEHRQQDQGRGRGRGTRTHAATQHRTQHGAGVSKSATHTYVPRGGVGGGGGMTSGGHTPLI